MPSSTYRVQLSAAFTLFDAADLAPYLAELGVGAVYISPILQSTHGSVHGYDVVNHAVLDPERGGELGLAALVQACAAAGLELVLDTVPNHMGVTAPIQNPAWWDVLRLGRGSAHATWFDIDWARGRILLPVLADGADLPTDLTVADDELRYGELRLPLAPGTGGGTALEVHDRQHYELVDHRRADTEQNYRRFFAVSGLAALRVEDPNVYEATHRELFRVITQHDVAGLRVDHPDGLTDPAQYLTRLRDSIGDRWLLVEKITAPDEPIPSNWPVDGLTGYDVLNEVTAVLVDPHAEAAMTSAYRDLTGDQLIFAEHEHDAKRMAATTILAAEVARIARLVSGVADAAAVLTELAVAFSVYRSYLPQGQQYLDEAAAAVHAARPELTDSLAALLPRLLDPSDEACTRFQQLSGAVMAKGVEDAAFYRYTRFIAFNEVGGSPARFGASLEQFHEWQSQRQQTSPNGMTTLSTHDTKRGEDIRARLAVLAELPEQWREAVKTAMTAAPIADGTVAYLLWQTAVAMAVDGLDDVRRSRLHAYLEKAMREAGVSTSWAEPDESFEATVHRAVDAVFDDQTVRAAITGLAALIEPHAWSNSLSQKVIQLTVPGVPDVYQGSELWEDSLVDPDNRRPVDFAARRAALSALDGPPTDDAMSKLWVTSRTLRTRRERPELFAAYQPLGAEGPSSDHLVAFDRGGAITLATRLPATLAASGWGDTSIGLPAGNYRDEFSGQTWTGKCAVSEVLNTYPVALLVIEDQR